MSGNIKLPIDVVPGTSPPIFKWRQLVDAPTGGTHTVEHVGALAPTVEAAVVLLIKEVKRLDRINGEMHQQVNVLRGSLNMTVDRLGGTVEGKPTHEGNYLQRIDELMRIEEAMSQRQASTVPIKGGKPR